LNFTTCLSSTYDDYEIRITNVIPATSAVELYLRFSTNGGSSYDAGSNYNWSSFRASSAGTANSGTGSGAFASQIDLAMGAAGGANAGYGFVGRFQLADPLNAVNNKRVNAQMSLFDGPGLVPNVVGMLAGTYVNATAVNAFQLLASSGNLTSGVVRCYGVSH
jgi:hypothetical protein